MGCGLAKQTLFTNINPEDMSAPISFKENKFSKADRSKRKQEGDRKEKASPTKTDGNYSGSIDRKGRKHGRGVFQYHCGDTYDGEWQKNQKHGMGTYTMANGDKYIGEFDTGIRCGKGRYEFASGAVYEGDFRANTMHGTGLFSFTDGVQYRGKFEHGVFHGMGQLLEEDAVVQGIWKRGALLRPIAY